MKIQVPPAPVGEVRKKASPSSLKSSLMEPFDDGFVGRIMVSMLGFGALLMLGVLSATNSPLLAGSFFSGILLGVLLLKSHELVVRNILAPRAAKQSSFWSRLPLAVILPLKYIFIGSIMGILFESGWLQPPALACGFIAGQIVIVAKVVGRFIALKTREH